MILLLLILSLSFGGFSQVMFEKPYYEPGDIALLHISGTLQYINIQNPPKEITGVWVHIYYPWGIKKVYLGDYSLCNQCTIPFSLSIPIYAKKEGVYEVRVKLTGTIELTDGKSRNLAYETSTVLRIEKIPNINISITPNVLPNKGSFQLIICTDKPIKNVKISNSILTKQYFLGNVYNCSSINTTYRTNHVGNLNTTFDISYKTMLGNQEHQLLPYILTFFKKQPRFSIILYNVLSNSPSESVLKIINNGDPANSVKVRSTVITFLNGEVNLGDITYNKSVYLNTYTNLTPGIYNIPMVVSWKEDGDYVSTVTNATVKIEGKDTLETYLEVGDRPVVGQPNTISVLVANKELYKIHSVVVSIDTPLKLLDGDNTKYIGEIDGDDYNSQQFTFLADKPGIYPINIEITYKSPLGKTKKLAFKKEIEVIQKKTDSFPIWLIGIIILVILGIVIWKWKK